MTMHDAAASGSSASALEMSTNLSSYLDRPVRKRVCSFDSLEVTESLGFQTHRNDSRHPWSKEEDALLYNIMTKMYGPYLESGEPFAVKWDVVACQIPSNTTRKGKDCRKRWSNSLDPTLRRGKWTKDEDDKLLAAYKKHGPSWYKVSSELKGRNDDQCAKRYSEVLDPSTKDRLKPWTREEDLRLIRMINDVGTKWKTISKEFNGRPALTVRNRWRKLLTGVVRGKADVDVMSEVDRLTNGNAKLLEQFGISGISHDKSSIVKMEKSDAEAVDGLADDETKESPKDYSDKNLNTQPSQQIVSPESNVIKNTSPSWTYSLCRDSSARPFPEFGGGVIKDGKTVRDLVEYAKLNNVQIVINQHNQAPASYSEQAPNILFDPNTPSASGISVNPLAKRSHHFTQLPKLAPFPKLSSSKPRSVASPREVFHAHHPTQTDGMSHKAFSHLNSVQPSSESPQAFHFSPGMLASEGVSTDVIHGDGPWPTLDTQFDNSQLNRHVEVESSSTGLDVFDALDDDMDAELVDSFGMFYNIMSRVPKPENEPEPTRTRHSSVDSILDAWGGGHDFVPFNPS